MKMRSVWLGLAILATLAWWTPPASSASTPACLGARKILALHRGLLDAHLRNDVEGVLGAEADTILVVSRGQVARQSKAERRARFIRYLAGVRFEEYRDLIDPVVHVSDDGTTGWLVARVRIVGTQAGDDGGTERFASTWAWIELYEKRHGRWCRVGEVSNLMPPDSVSSGDA